MLPFIVGLEVCFDATGFLLRMYLQRVWRQVAFEGPKYSAAAFCKKSPEPMLRDKKLAAYFYITVFAEGMASLSFTSPSILHLR